MSRLLVLFVGLFSVHTSALSMEPVPSIEDKYYPVEEREEGLSAMVPVVHSIDLETETCELASPASPHQISTFAQGDLAFGEWIVQSILSNVTGLQASTTLVTLERRFDRWGLLVFSSVFGEIIRIRKPMGKLDQLSTVTYNLTASDPQYFNRAADQPDDYIGRRILNDSEYGETSFLTAAKYLPPIADYVIIGGETTPIKAVVTMNGKIKRTDGPNDEPIVTVPQNPEYLNHQTTQQEPSTSMHFSNAMAGYIVGYPGGVPSSYSTLSAAKAACLANRLCGGVTLHYSGQYEQRAYPNAPQPSPHNETSWIVIGRPDPPNSCNTSCDCGGGCSGRGFCKNSQCQSGGATIFSAEEYLSLPSGSPGGFYENMQTGVLGGFLRIADIGCYQPGIKSISMPRGFEMMSLGPLSIDNDTVLVAIRNYSATASINASFSYLAVSLNLKWETPRSVTPATFFREVLTHALDWNTKFSTINRSNIALNQMNELPETFSTTSSLDSYVSAMQPFIPYEERRLLDMARGVIVASSSIFIGKYPNYGSGGNYWASSPPLESMLDTSGIGGALPLTSLALNDALLRWGLIDDALEKIGTYFDTFIFPNGTIDMGHWKDIWPDDGIGQYNCTFPDGLSDHGRMIQLFVDAVRMSKNISFMKRHLPAVSRIGRYLLRSRAEAVSSWAPSDPRHGLIYGPAEHDTCDIGMGDSAAVVDGQLMLYYFSVSFWHWRGMVELGHLLKDYPAASGSTANATFADELLNEADVFKLDIDAALNRSIIKNGSDIFIPAAVASAEESPIPYASMTADVLASYSNFRYYSEMLGAGYLTAENAKALMDFRETHGGCLSGMSRYSDHLDDMPAIGYAVGSLEHDRIDSYLLLLFGHAANYQGRGSFFTTEQQSLYQLDNSSHWRASLGEIQADFCVPSQALVASMTAMAFLWDSRDDRTIWLARAAPRRWYQSSEGFGAENIPSRYGRISFAINGSTASISFDGIQPSGALAKPVTLNLRLRDPRHNSAPDKLLSVKVIHPDADCKVLGLAEDAQNVVSISPTKGLTVSKCAIAAEFSDN